MPNGFVEQLCRAKFADAALLLFSAKMPWQRLYVKAKAIEPVNTFGGEQSERWMDFGEEVLLLRRREAGGGSGVQVSGPQDVDVLRWDGTCATVRQEMLVSYVPGTAHRMPAPWKYLEEATREALLDHQTVSKADEATKSACKGITVPEQESRCERAQAKLTDAIAQALRSGVELPVPTKVPAWRE